MNEYWKGLTTSAGTETQGWTKHQLSDPWAPTELWVVVNDGGTYTIQNACGRTYLELRMLSPAHALTSLTHEIVQVTLPMGPPSQVLRNLPPTSRNGWFSKLLENIITRTFSLPCCVSPFTDDLCAAAFKTNIPKVCLTYFPWRVAHWSFTGIHSLYWSWGWVSVPMSSKVCTMISRSLAIFQEP